MEGKPKDDERFDASQYAFFGGDISQDVELGGLDEEDEIAVCSGAFQEDERSSPLLNEKKEAEVLDTISQLDDPLDISNISSSYRKQREGPEIGLTSVPLPVARPPPPIPLRAEMFHNGQQQAVALQGNFLPGYWPRVPLPLRGPLQPYSHHGGSLAFFPPSPLWHLMPPLQQGISRGIAPQFMQHQLAQQYASLSPLVSEALLQRHPRIPFVNAHRALFNPILSLPSNDYFYENDDRRSLYECEQRHRQKMPLHQRSHGVCKSLNRDNTQQHFRSKCMTFEEIEGIAKIQRAAMQINDPYISDYYHQAVQAKNGTVTIDGKHNFAPHQLRDWSSRRRSSVLQPTFVPVDGLGKVPFSSARSPRPLLEVEDLFTGGGKSLTLSEQPLEQEPMLAARNAIEDGSCCLLDVDDIDRYILASHLPDGGARLQRQRQTLLEDIATALQLLEPFISRGDSKSSTKKNGHLIEAGEAKDQVFLHVVSLPKGRKLLCRFLELLPEGSQLLQSVCVNIFRHLHFLFGVREKDPDAEAATSNLAKKLASCAAQMDLKAVSACVAAVVSSSEQPSFKPFSAASGDGVSLILKCSLDRATYLLTDPRFACLLEDRKFWQATFDDFFHMLYKYCTNMFDRILHTLAIPSSLEGSLNVVETVAEKMSKELPIELLRASLPHMNEQQRKALLDFTQRSIAKEASVGHDARGDTLPMPSMAMDLAHAM